MKTLRPICFPDPVMDRANLYDRVTALTDVLDSLRHRSTVVLGGRLIGKTSLLNVVGESVEGQREFAMIRLAPADSRIDFMAEIMDGIYQWVDGHFRDSSSIPVLEQSVGTVAQFCQRIAVLAERADGVMFILCLDEFDSLVQNCDEREARLLLELIEHLDAMPALPVRFLLTMSAIPDLLLHSSRSPFINKTRIVSLEPWDADEAASFIEWLAGDDFIFDEPALSTLFAAAGGHPYFTKAVLTTLITGQAHVPGSRYVSAARVDAAVRKVARSKEVNLALTNLVGAHLSADATAVLDRAANSPAGISGRVISELPTAGTLLDRLQDDGLLRQQGDRYLLRLGLWREWRTTTRGGSARPPLLSRIRGAIRRTRHQHAIFLLLLIALAVPLLTMLLATTYLVQERTVVYQPCGISAAKPVVRATYPAFASNGDQQQIHVVIVNNGKTDMDGSVLVSFPADQAQLDSANGTTFNGLRPGEEARLDVYFTTISPPGWLIGSGSHVGVELAISAHGGCEAERWSMSVAPVPRLQFVQKLAGGVLAIFLLPLMVEFVGGRLLHGRKKPRAHASSAKGS